MTTELIAYARKIVAERGISQKDFTPAVAGEVLAEAVRRMDKVVTRTMSSSKAMYGFTANIYQEITAREVERELAA